MEEYKAKNSRYSSKEKEQRESSFSTKFSAYCKARHTN